MQGASVGHPWAVPHHRLTGPICRPVPPWWATVALGLLLTLLALLPGDPL